MTLNPLFKSGRKVLAALPVGLTACQLAAALPPDQEKLVAANNAFAFNLMNQVTRSQPGANVFLSPFSVASVLQMVNNGAAGETKKEIQQMLKTDGLAPGGLNEAFKDLNAQLTARPAVTLNLANGMWIKEGFHLRPAFVADNQKYFQAELAAVDFASPQAAQTINDWAARKTQDKIKAVVQYPFPPLTRLILANAIYFKGAWEDPFEARLTQPRDFHLADGQTKPAPMMAQTGNYWYQETPDFQAVKLPYQGGLQMELYLPATNSTPQQLLARLAGAGGWQMWQGEVQAQFRRREGAITVPKFKIEYARELNAALQALGMKQAFGGAADFSGIADEKLAVSQVQQKSYVAVDERGTEAAAVTTVVMTSAAIMRPPPDRFTMILNRPFFFVIADVPTGSILFTGVVNDPGSGG